MAQLKFTGSICLDTIPQECIKQGNNGHLYVNIAVLENDTPIYHKETNEVAFDHFISCAPKKEERVEGRKYIFGNLRTWQEAKAPIVTTQDVNAMPSVPAGTQMPWHQQYQQPAQQQTQQYQQQPQQYQQPYQQPYQQQSQSYDPFRQ